MNLLQLQSCLSVLTETVRRFSRRNRKLIYMDASCFYRLIRSVPLVTPVLAAFTEPPAYIRRIDDMLDILAPYLPLSLLDNAHYELFLRAAGNMANTPLTEEIPNYFAQKARMDFILSLYRAGSAAQAAQVTRQCEEICMYSGSS